MNSSMILQECESCNRKEGKTDFKAALDSRQPPEHPAFTLKESLIHPTLSFPQFFLSLGEGAEEGKFEDTAKR